MSADRVLLVSSDGHVGAPVATYRDYLEPSYRGQYDEWLAQHRVVQEAMRAGFADRPRPGRRSPFISDEPGVGIDIHEVLDPPTRLAAVEGEGAVAEVLFPGPDFGRELGFPFSPLSSDLSRSLSFGIFSADPQQMELAMAGERAYNRWLAEFCSASPGRLIGLLQVPRYDMELAVGEVEWGRAAGLGGVQLPADDPNAPPYWDEYWEPLWVACEHLGLPIHFHAGSYHGQDFGIRGGNDDLRMQVLLVEATFWYSRQLKFLIYAGVMERHPRLNFVFTEGMADWVPYTLARMELVHRDVSFRGVAPIDLPRPPSEYWYRQCHIGASLLSRDEVLLRHQIGTGNMMFGLDYPHPEGSWLRTEQWLAQVFGATGIAEDELRKILGLNAVRLYGLDLKLLQPLADRFGPTAASVADARPKPAEAWGDAFAYSPSPYRRAAWPGPATA